MNWLLKILSLVPVIAQGVQMIHSDLGSKQALAQDSLALAVAGAATLAPEQAQTITAIGSIAASALSQTVAALHTAGQPAQAAQTA